MPEIAIARNQKTIEEIIEAQASSKGKTRNTGELGKDDFLKLLITQVQNQDPMNPSSDTDFIAQMAQFSALEQMQNLNQSFSYSMGFSMMGKYITAEVTDETTGDTRYVSGKVEMIRVINGKVHAVVGNDDVPVDKITQVSDDRLDFGGSVTEYSGIIGMLGKANIFNDDDKISSIEGIISSITSKNGMVFARLDEVDIKPYRLDIGAFESEEEYVGAMIGREITVRFEDETTGHKYEVTGILRSGYEGSDGELRLILDNIEVPANSIYSTQGIDLLSTEQMLLNAILKELQKLNNPQTGDGTEEPSDPEENNGDEEADPTEGV